MASVFDLIAPGASVWIKVAIVAGIALVAAAGATFVTANYYNNKLIAATQKAEDDKNAAVAQAGIEAIKAQKSVDAQMTTARLADQKARDDRERKSAVNAEIAAAFLRKHPASDDKACYLPMDAAHAINQVLQ